MIKVNKKIWTMLEIQQRNKAKWQYWFSPDTLRFFKSRIYDTVYQGKGGIFFVTSERFDDTTPRLYSVRQFNPAEGSISTIGEFQEHETRYFANKEAARLAKK